MSWMCRDGRVFYLRVFFILNLLLLAYNFWNMDTRERYLEDMECRGCIVQSKDGELLFKGNCSAMYYYMKNYGGGSVVSDTEFLEYLNKSGGGVFGEFK